MCLAEGVIEIRPIDATTWEVTVRSAVETRHRVTLTSERQREIIGAGGVEPAALIEESFRFLLEREPNTSILRSFDLGVIGRYFPEYQDAMRRRFEERRT